MGELPGFDPSTMLPYTANEFNASHALHEHDAMLGGAVVEASNAANFASLAEEQLTKIAHSLMGARTKVGLVADLFLNPKVPLPADYAKTFATEAKEVHSLSYDVEKHGYDLPAGPDTEYSKVFDGAAPPVPSGAIAAIRVLDGKLSLLEVQVQAALRSVQEGHQALLKGNFDKAAGLGMHDPNAMFNFERVAAIGQSPKLGQCDVTCDQKLKVVQA